MWWGAGMFNPEHPRQRYLPPHNHQLHHYPSTISNLSPSISPRKQWRKRIEEVQAQPCSPLKGGRVVEWALGLSILLWASLALRSCWESQQADWRLLCSLFGEWVVHPALLWAPRPQASASSIVLVRVNHSATEIAPVGLKNSR